MGGWLVTSKCCLKTYQKLTTDNGWGFSKWHLKPKAHRVAAYQKRIKQLRTETDQKLTKKANRAVISIVCVFSPATGLFELLVALGSDREPVSQGQGLIEIFPF